MDEQGAQWCDCPACQQLQAMDAFARQLEAAQRAAVPIIDRFDRRPWPLQRKGACQSADRLAWLYRMTVPIRGRRSEEGMHGQAAVAAAQAVEGHANDHDDDDDV